MKITKKQIQLLLENIYDEYFDKNKEIFDASAEEQSEFYDDIPAELNVDKVSIETIINNAANNKEYMSYPYINGILSINSFTKYFDKSDYGLHLIKEESYKNFSNMRKKIKSEYNDIFNNLKALLSTLPEDPIEKAKKITQYGLSLEKKYFKIMKKIKKDLESADGFFASIKKTFSGQSNEDYILKLIKESDIYQAIAILLSLIYIPTWYQTQISFPGESKEKLTIKAFRKSETITQLGRVGMYNASEGVNYIPTIPEQFIFPKSEPKSVKDYARARKDFFRRSMAAREKRKRKRIGDKELEKSFFGEELPLYPDEKDAISTIDDWFVIHYPFSFSYPRDGNDYFSGLAKFIRDVGKKTNSGEILKSSVENAGVAYPKEAKYQSDDLGTGLAGLDKFPKIGFVLDGRITAIYRNDVHSDTFRSSERKTGHGGFRGTGHQTGIAGKSFVRYPGGEEGKSFKGAKYRSSSLILDLDSYKEEVLKDGFSQSYSGYNETFIDNWQIKGIIANWDRLIRSENTLVKILADSGITTSKDMPRLINSLSQLVYTVKSYGLTIYDQKFKPLSNEDLLKKLQSLFEAIATKIGFGDNNPDDPYRKLTVSYSKGQVSEPDPKKETKIWFVAKYKGKTLVDHSGKENNKIEISEAIKIYNQIRKKYEKAAERPKFYYATNKSKRGKYNWNLFSPMIIKRSSLNLNEEMIRYLIREALKRRLNIF